VNSTTRARPSLKRPAGRPSHSWLCAIEADMKLLNIGLSSAWSKGNHSGKLAIQCGQGISNAHVQNILRTRNAIGTYRPVLISIRPVVSYRLFFGPQSDTSLHCETMDMRLRYRLVYFFTSQLLLVLIAPTHGGMDRLSLYEYLIIYGDCLPAQLDGYPPQY